MNSIRIRELVDIDRAIELCDSVIKVRVAELDKRSIEETETIENMKDYRDYLFNLKDFIGETEF
ncbi:TPA: hypothetical protein JF854_001500 [Enterobacter hormaechei subsp. steigerwaltii]|uniref:hypothetical protein n=1 Tax=Enterobacter hormaechei TaxID=158836 RepID=UPI0005F16937|nr:hypothetical protein [Enterobacter hormaechei]HAS0712529.1 hypothetical protein [Enterobacter hormaechei subsp. steigerwaltii]KJL72583.1 hypothetical protein SS38_05735 [Enterobacter hormaechei subsp. xiangfangensis]HAS0890277.1 hypothetical protein [Enterobacter hormaechei subsp. steigerwaltii]HAS0898912.1 hypothetical protein [Enterobacter hormaechei subsp. steigerwaltii]HAT7679703.1 hypothetical protein [Enterobacter hormaechei subsp. steigerwaltii]